MCTVKILAVGWQLGKVFIKDSKVQSTRMHCTRISYACVCVTTYTFYALFSFCSGALIISMCSRYMYIYLMSKFAIIPIPRIVIKGGGGYSEIGELRGGMGVAHHMHLAHIVITTLSFLIEQCSV